MTAELHLPTLSKKVTEINNSPLPERILQFGTGVLLRALPDYYIDKANKKGIFNGSVLVVKSTDGGESDAFEKQDCLYTICIRGIKNGKPVHENIINSAINRVLIAKTNWQDVLESAGNPDINIVISNTTESGIRYTEESIQLSPPLSFPAKLLAFLHERYTCFNGDKEKGLIIIPTELIENNATVLQGILNQLAHFNKLSPSFIEWMNHSNKFCNSLVDRIVPGKAKEPHLTSLYHEIGYKDDLLTIAEEYSLWAIEGDDEVKNKLSFSQADSSVIITQDIQKFRELKLRLLNATHSLCCGLAHLCGFKTVYEATCDSGFRRFLKELMFDEIAASIPMAIDKEELLAFASSVLDRFSNPAIEHRWLSISLNYTYKIKIRTVPLLLKYYERFGIAPDRYSWGFAAYLLFMKSSLSSQGNYVGNYKGAEYPIPDEKALFFSELWQNNKDTKKIVSIVLENEDLWGCRLNELPGFAASLTEKLNTLLSGNFTSETFCNSH